MNEGANERSVRYRHEAPAERGEAAPRRPPRRALRRVLDVARIQALNWAGLFAWPLGILGFALLVNIVLFAAMDDPDGYITGALMSVYLVVLATHVQTMTQGFPFALGLSVTRRDFYAGTGLLVLVQAAAFGLALLLLRTMEWATGGWGIGLVFLGLPFYDQLDPLALWLVYTVPFLAMSVIGAFMGVVFKRWNQSGLFVMGLGAAVVLTGLVLLVDVNG